MNSPARTSRRLGELAVALTVVVTSLLLLPRQASPFALPKQLVGETLALVSLAALWPAWLAGRGWREIRRGVALRAVGPLVVVAWLTLFWSVAPGVTRGAAVSLAIGAACLVIWSGALTREQLDRQLALLAGLGGVQAALAIAQYHDWFDPLVFQGRVSLRTGLTALVGAAGDLGAYLVLPLLVVQWRWNAATPGRRRMGWLALGGLLAYGLFVTGTLTALLAAGAASLVLWWRPERRRTVSALIVGLALIVALGAAVSDPLRQQIQGKAAALRSGDWNSLLTGRMDGWKVAGAIWQESPWGGIGWGAYRTAFGATKLELATEGAEFFPGHLYPAFQNAHSEALEVAAEAGLLGVVATLWALALLVGSWRRIEAADDRTLARAGVVAVTLVSLAYFPFRIAVTAYPVLVFLAWMVAIGNQREEVP